MKLPRINKSGKLFPNPIVCLTKKPSRLCERVLSGSTYHPPPKVLMKGSTNVTPSFPSLVESSLIKSPSLTFLGSRSLPTTPTLQIESRAAWGVQSPAGDSLVVWGMVRCQSPYWFSLSALSAGTEYFAR